MAKKYTQKQNNNSYDALIQAGAALPPQAVELEEAVLGALMLEKDSIVEVHEFLMPEAFYKEAHKIIFSAISSLNDALNPIDIYTVNEYLKQHKQLEAVGGTQYLIALTQKVGSAAHIVFHAKIIAQKYVQRELIRASTEIQRRSYDEENDVTDLIDFAEGEIFKVSEGHVRRSIQSSKDIIKKTLDTIEEASKNDSKFSGVPSGFTSIDKVTLGWQASDLIIIAARPSMGKTAFTLTMARNMAVQHDIPVAFFSLEMSAMQLMMRLIVAESGLDMKNIRSGNLSPKDWRQMEQAIKPLEEAPLFIDDTPALPLTEFRSKARRLKTHEGIQLIIIDYLQLMSGPQETKGNREQEVSTISRTLKAIAKELEIPIIALSQLNRGVEARTGSNKRPQLSDLRESGAIEQDADIVAFIHRPEYYKIFVDEQNMPLPPGYAEFILAKHRNGETTTIGMKFRKEEIRFSDLDETEYSFSDSDSINGGGAPDDSYFDSLNPSTISDEAPF